MKCNENVKKKNKNGRKMTHTLQAVYRAYKRQEEKEEEKKTLSALNAMVI